MWEPRFGIENLMWTGSLYLVLWIGGAVALAVTLARHGLPPRRATWWSVLYFMPTSVLFVWLLGGPLGTGLLVSLISIPAALGTSYLGDQVLDAGDRRRARAKQDSPAPGRGSETNDE